MGQRPTPGEGGDLADFRERQHQEDREGHHGKDEEGNPKAREDGGHQFLRLVLEASRHLGHHVLHRVAEDGDIENRHGVGPVGVEDVFHRHAGREHGRPRQHEEHGDHAAGNKFLRHPGGLETKPNDHGGRHHEENASGLKGNPQKVSEDFSAAIGVSDETAKAGGPDGEEEHPSAHFADIFLRQPRKLQRRPRAKGRLGHVEHGHRGHQGRHDEKNHQHRPAGLPRGVGQAQDAGADGGSHDHHSRLDKGQLVNFQSALRSSRRGHHVKRLHNVLLLRAWIRSKGVYGVS